MNATTKEYKLTATYELITSVSEGVASSKLNNLPMSTLELRAPRGINSHVTDKLRSLFMMASVACENEQAKAKAKENDNKENDNKENDTAETDAEILSKGKLMLSLMQAYNLYVEYAANFKTLMTQKGICKVNGLQDITSNWYDLLEDHDRLGLMAVYTGNFITL